MNTADTLYRNRDDALEYASKVGKAEPHLGNRVGRLHLVEVSTEICHQASTSATNYWKNANFDQALARVIQGRFAALAAEAVRLMTEAADAALASEEAELRERLARVDALRTAQASVPV